MDVSRQRSGDPLLATAGLSLLLLLAPAGAAAQLVVDDPLTGGTTIGNRDNGPGEFTARGWRVTSASDNIRYTPPFPIEEGAIEWDVSGLRFDDTRPQNHRGQLISMYDASFGNPRQVYFPDLRRNPFKFVIQRNGRDEEAYFANYLKLSMSTDGVNQFQEYSSVGAFPWQETETYHMRLEWRDGVIRFFINGRDLDRWPFVYRNLYRPGIHDIRIGTNTRDNAILDAVYSNVKIYDYGRAPASPLINNPRESAPSRSLTPVIDWTGERHDRYEVRITHSPDPSTGVAWESGQVESSRHYAVAGPLADGATYYAHARLRNDRGWGAWSAAQRFEVRADALPSVPRYGEHEIVLRTTNPRSSPYTQVSLSATFVGPGRTLTVNGFWDGGELYKLRMMPTEPGMWSWTTSSNDSQLNGRTGSFRCVESSNRGYVRVSDELPYTFDWAGNRTPFFLMGDTLWHLYYNVRFDGSFQRLIDDRAAQGFNYVHGVVHDFLHNEGGPIYSRQRQEEPARFDVDTLNPAYFHGLDRKIDYLNARGMVAGLFFSWGNEGYQDYDNADQYVRYIRYLAARYASKNVFWILVGEYEEAGEPLSRWRDYARVLREADPYGHPVTLHTTETTDSFGNDEEHSFVSQQRSGSPEELRQLIARSRRFGKPVINLEYGYEGDPAVIGNTQLAPDVRKDHYALVLSGGYGVYGNHVPNYSTYHRVGDFVLTATDTPAARDLKTLFGFFAETNFHRLTPAQHLVSRGIAAAWPGREYLVQLPEGGGVEVDLSAASGALDWDWFDPRTGQRMISGRTEGGARRSFEAPDGNDWILHVYRYPRGPSATASINLGSPDIEQGLRRVETADGETEPASIGNRLARRNVDPARNYYFYFDVEDGFAFRGNRPEAFISIEYFDGAQGFLTLQYDGGSSAFADGGTVSFTGSNTFRSHTFHVSDAFFGNRQNGGADFRLFGGVGNVIYLDVVRIARERPGAPTTATEPAPPDGAVGVDLGADLRWRAGSGATSHQVYFGTASPPPLRTHQAATTYDPGDLSPRTTFFWRIDEVNPEGVASGPVWSFTTLGPPGTAAQPSPGNGANGVATQVRLSWTPGMEAAAHDVYFGPQNPPPLAARVTAPGFDVGPLAPRTTYYWRIDALNGAGTAPGPLWSFSTADTATRPTLEVKAAGGIFIDGDPTDWALDSRASKVRAGERVGGETALIGFDEGVLYAAGYATHLTLPQNAADHTARVYSRHDLDGLYFLVRVDDSDIRTPFAADMNWANDCVEFYVDPSSNRGASTMASSQSDVQLVIDAANQVNVYMTTASYRTRVLAGVRSAVRRDAAGFWLEVAVQKTALEPALPQAGALGLDLNFRDNDADNHPGSTTVYTWADFERSGSFPSKIPDRWGDASLAVLTGPGPGAARDPRPAQGETGVDIRATLSWTAGANAASHDVYFGAINPPPFQINQSESRFPPGPLQAGVTYYWRVDEVNGAEKTTGVLWSFSTLALPGRASGPEPATGSREVAENVLLSWNAGTDAASHDVYFGTVNPPPFQGTQLETTFDPGALMPGTTYFWKIDEGNGSGSTPGDVWVFTTASGVAAPTLRFLEAGVITIDGSPADWNLAEFGSLVRGGERVAGEVALVGFVGGSLFWAGRATQYPLPTTERDHTARIYARHDSGYLYFLVRVDDDDVRASHAAGMNWANDAVEIYIDPANDGGVGPLNNSTSDIQLVIDAANQKNAYMVTESYRSRVLGGLSSAVTRDATGFWLELRLEKTVLSPAVAASGVIGLDFNFRDNDRDNDPRETTVYTWSDPEQSGSFPSKIPDRWGKGVLPTSGNR